MKKFEERLGRLEEISDKIKDADVPLENAFALFEEGITLANSLEKDVEKLEGKVQILINGEDLDKNGSDKKNRVAVEPEFGLFSEEDLN